MRRGFARIFLCILFCLGVASCSLLPKDEHAGTEMKISDLRMPDVVQEGLTYEVLLSYDKATDVRVEEICFRWVYEKAPYAAPWLAFQASDVQSNNRMGDDTHYRALDGPNVEKSDLFCVSGKEAKEVTPGVLSVKITPRQLHPNYNKLECRVRYSVDGTNKETNSVTTRMTVGK